MFYGLHPFRNPLAVLVLLVLLVLSLIVATTIDHNYNNNNNNIICVHPVRNPRLAPFRTQPLENLSAAVKLPIKRRFLGNPTLGTNLG